MNESNKKTNKKRVTSVLIAEVVERADSTVRQVKNGFITNNLELAAKVQLAEEILEKGMQQLVNETKTIIRIKSK